MNKKTLKFLKILIRQTILLLILILVSCGIDTNSDENSLKNQNSLSVIIISSDISIGLNKIKFAVLNLEGNPILNQEKNLKVFISPLEDPQFKKPISIEWEPWPISGGVYKSNIELKSSGFWKINHGDFIFLLIFAKLSMLQGFIRFLATNSRLVTPYMFPHDCR